MQNILVDNAKVMTKGQITLPKDIRDSLGVKTGDKVTFIAQNDQVIMMNASVYALKILQESMKGEAAKAGINSPDDVDSLIMEMRIEDEQEIQESL